MASGVIAQAALLDLQARLVDVQRKLLAQLGADLSQALADHAADPSPPQRERVLQLTQQAQQLRQDLVARGVNVPPLDLPGLPPAPTPAPTATSRPAPERVPGSSGPAVPASEATTAVLVAATATHGLAAGLAWAADSQRPGPASTVAPTASGPAASSQGIEPRAAVPSPSMPAPIPSPHHPPQAGARIVDLPTASSPPSAVPLGDLSRAGPQAAAAHGLSSGSAADRSGFSELERQRAVAASRGSLDEASTRQARHAGHPPGQQHPPRDDHLLSAREWAHLSHLWQCCRLALQAWRRQPGAATQAAARLAFDDLEQFGRWMASQGKSVPPAPTDLANPFTRPRA